MPLAQNTAGTHMAVIYGRDGGGCLPTIFRITLNCPHQNLHIAVYAGNINICRHIKKKTTIKENTCSSNANKEPEYFTVRQL